MTNYNSSRKSLEHLIEKMADENRLRRALGRRHSQSWTWTANIGAGILVRTGGVAAGLVFYFAYGYRHSILGTELVQQLAQEGVGPTDAPLRP